MADEKVKAEKTGVEDPHYTVILIADDGTPYKLTKEAWMKAGTKLPAAGGGIVDQLREFGVYLSYIPPEIAVGIGEVCTVVNLQAILKNNTNGASSAAAGKDKKD